MIAVCDHNSAGNIGRRAGSAARPAGERLAVLAGMEVTSAEECHVVGLFPDAAAAEAAGRRGGRPACPPRTTATSSSSASSACSRPTAAQRARDASPWPWRRRSPSSQVVRSSTATAGWPWRPTSTAGRSASSASSASSRPRPASTPWSSRATWRRGLASARPSSPSTACPSCTRPTPTTRTTSAPRAPRCTWPSPTFAELALALRGEGGRSVADA